METLTGTLEMLRQWLSRLGPYFLVEILLPGGTLFALLLYLYRRANSGIGQDSLRPAMALSRRFVGSSQRQLNGRPS
jgi:hypothetical protein